MANNINDDRKLAIIRVIDANVNRLKEGIRVIEDIARYIFNDKTLSSTLKNLRHAIVVSHPCDLLNQRDIINDISKQTIESEKNRSDILSILECNFRRCAESARVLEEFIKLDIDCFKKQNIDFKNIRYEIYNLHKIMILKYFSKNQ